jgi:hypothetical protein
MPSRACRGTIGSSTRSWRTTTGVGEAGFPVTVVSLPGRRAGLEFVEKLLPTNLTSTDTTGPCYLNSR